MASRQKKNKTLSQYLFYVGHLWTNLTNEGFQNMKYFFYSTLNFTAPIANPTQFKNEKQWRVKLLKPSEKFRGEGNSALCTEKVIPLIAKYSLKKCLEKYIFVKLYLMDMNKFSVLLHVTTKYRRYLPVPIIRDISIVTVWHSRYTIVCTCTRM